MRDKGGRQGIVRTFPFQVLLVNHVDHLLRHPQVLDAVSPDVALRNLPEPVSILTRWSRKEKKWGARGSDQGGKSHESLSSLVPLFSLLLAPSLPSSLALLTLEVQMTSLNVMFIQVSHETSRPLYVSPFLSSTSMGWPCAVFRSDKGSFRRWRDVAGARKLKDYKMRQPRSRCWICARTMIFLSSRQTLSVVDGCDKLARAPGPLQYRDKRGVTVRRPAGALCCCPWGIKG